jgi:hypothetical protein
MKNSFIKHVAQAIKYYTFDDMTDRDIRYGQDQEKFRSRIYQDQMTEY